MVMAGYSLIEVIVATTILVILATMAVPIVFSAVEYSRAAAAARYVAGRIGVARLEAVKRSTNVAVRFEVQDGRYGFGTYADGNGNGVRNSDIASRIDFPLALAERLETHFSGVTFGLHEGVLPVSADESLSNSDPIRVGQSNLLSFSPRGSATSGTVYIRGKNKQQFAVRVLGVTGRVRVLRFDFQNRRWTAP